MIAAAAPVRCFSEALHSNGPAAEWAHKTHLYSWLVGDWDMDVVIYRSDGSKQRSQGWVSAGWVLEGRAIQDIFAAPRLFCGTTLRVYDPGLDAWRINWTDPMNQVYFWQIGRARGADIVEEGKETPSLARLYGSVPASGPQATIRWSFTEITPDSFHWRSERSVYGASWQLQREYFARRVG
ncbi:MAG TPA: hypothetical protein VMT20_04760 [Terriglobia bacterium]|nr:hypothetical protein [Terriglobia bacterium]